MFAERGVLLAECCFFCNEVGQRTVVWACKERGGALIKNTATQVAKCAAKRATKRNIIKEGVAEGRGAKKVVTAVDLVKCCFFLSIARVCSKTAPRYKVTGVR